MLEAIHYVETVSINQVSKRIDIFGYLTGIATGCTLFEYKK